MKRRLTLLAFAALGLIGVLTVVAACASAGSARPRTTITSCAGNVAADSTVYDTTQVTEQPSHLRGPLLEYPISAREQGVQGRVLISFIIEATGDVDQSSLRIVRRADARLEAEAVRYVRSATFSPGCRSGIAVRVRVQMPIDFKLFGGPSTDMDIRRPDADGVMIGASLEPR